MKVKKVSAKNKIITSSVAAALLITGMLSHRGDSYFMSKSVKLVSARGSCSGEQVVAPSGVSYILTAAHCRLLEKDGSITAITEDGKTLERKIIAEDPKSDLMLLEGIPNLSGLDIASDQGRGQHVRTYTHGSGYSTYKTEGELIDVQDMQIPVEMVVDAELTVKCELPKYSRMQIQTPFGLLKACVLSVTETVTTAKIVPGSSGGMVVDDSGRLVGVVSAGNSDTGFGYLVTVKDIQSFTRNY